MACWGNGKHEVIRVCDGKRVRAPVTLSGYPNNVKAVLRSAGRKVIAKAPGVDALCAKGHKITRIS